MIRVNELKLSIFDVTPETETVLLKRKLAGLFGIRPDAVRKLRVIRRSVDARKKNAIMFSYTLDLKLSDSVTGPSAATEAAFIDRLRKPGVSVSRDIPWAPPSPSPEAATYFAQTGRPVIVGAGPCGLFAAYVLAKAGVKPIILERGKRIEERMDDVKRFFETGVLDPSSNVQFGEGGAGTFSDGKLATSIKGQQSLIRAVLSVFCAYGADPSILTEQKPHLGTDQLHRIIVKLRQDLLSMGAEFHFESRFSGICLSEGVLSEVLYERGGSEHRIRTGTLILAIGHSARDTLEMLYQSGLTMEQKPFAMGLRIQHPQERIDRALYGEDRLPEKQRILGPASYKLTHRCQNGRSLYSFCMCPGGYVINASSETGRLCVNGMSNSKRDSGTANAAICVNITKEDFPDEDPLSGIRLQRSLEEAAFAICEGKIPVECYGDYRRGVTDHFQRPDWDPKFCGDYAYADLRALLPPAFREAFSEGMEAFEKQIPGYSADDALLCGWEARTSSPVRILRNERFLASVPGIYPAGEGAGYAGGITSAAIDGIRVAEAVLANSMKS